jgi:hypothetical protein
MKRIFAFAFAALLASPLYADTKIIGASQDTSIFQEAANANNSDGGGPGIFAGDSGGGTGFARRGLIEFDITDNIPVGATITGVQLTLVVGQAPNANSRTIGLFALTSSWGEGTTGSTKTALSGTGSGFPANPGDATWNARFYSSTSPTLWNTPGGDFNIASPASASLTLSPVVGNTAIWTSAGLVSDVQGWLNNPSSNDGWLLKNFTETGPQTVVGFYSREWGTVAGEPANASTQQPQLQITFTVPEPCTGFLIVTGMMGLIITRRRSERRLPRRGIAKS